MRDRRLKHFPLPDRFPSAVESGSPRALLSRHDDYRMAQLRYRATFIVEELAVRNELLRDVVGVVKPQERLECERWCRLPQKLVQRRPCFRAQLQRKLADVRLR